MKPDKKSFDAAKFLYDYGYGYISGAPKKRVTSVGIVARHQANQVKNVLPTLVTREIAEKIPNVPCDLCGIMSRGRVNPTTRHCYNHEVCAENAKSWR